MGGLTPKLDIFVSFFSERPPIPKRIVQSLEPSGRLGGELDRAVKDGIIREVEVGMIIDEGTARSLIDWLSTQLESLKEIKEKVRAKSSDNVPDDTRLH